MRRGAARAQLERDYRRYIVAFVDRAAPCINCAAPAQIWSSTANGLVCAPCYRASLPGGPDEGPKGQPTKHLSHP